MEAKHQNTMCVSVNKGGWRDMALTNWISFLWRMGIRNRLWPCNFLRMGTWPWPTDFDTGGRGTWP